MASTNKTANYSLPQWVGSDHPTWKGDLNDAFSKIDTTLKTNETNNQKTSSIVTSLSEQVGANRSAIESVNDTLETSSQESASALQLAKNALGSVEETNRNVSSLQENVNTVKTNVANNSARLDALEKQSGGTSGIDVNEFKRLCLDILYPVGSMYFTTADKSPGVLFGGSWQKVPTGYYLRAGNPGGKNTGQSYYDFTITQNNSPYSPATSEASGYGLSQVEGFKNRVVITKTRTPQRISVPLTPLAMEIVAWKRIG